MPQISQLSDVLATQIFWLAIVFGLIFFGIGRGLLPKIRSTVDARDLKVANDLEKAKAARESADQTEAEWRARMDQARAEAARLAQKSKNDGAIETEARLKEAFGEIDARVERARLRIRAAVETARAEMETAAVEVAREMVEKLTGLKVDKKDAAGAVAAELQLLASTSQMRQVPRSGREQKQAALGGR
jgi:F-type H+-transporting ATPase subunit b